MTAAEQLLAQRQDDVGLAVRQRLLRGRIESVLAGDMTDEPADWWRHYAGVLESYGHAAAAERLNAIAALCEELQL